MEDENVIPGAEPVETPARGAEHVQGEPGLPDLSDIFGADEPVDPDDDLDDDAEGQDKDDDGVDELTRLRKQLAAKDRKIARVSGQRDKWRGRYEERTDQGRGQERQPERREPPARRQEPAQVEFDPSNPEHINQLVSHAVNTALGQQSQQQAAQAEANKLRALIREGGEAAAAAAFVERVQDVDFYPQTLRTVNRMGKHGVAALAQIGQSEARIRKFSAMTPEEQVAHVAEIGARFKAAEAGNRRGAQKPTPKASGNASREKDPSSFKTQREYDAWHKKTYPEQYR